MDNENIVNKDFFSILNNIFVYIENEKKFLPILKKQFNSSITSLFEYLLNENNKNIESCLKILYYIFNQSTDIAIIITLSSFFKEKKNYNFLTLLIDLYIKLQKKKFSNSDAQTKKSQTGQY